MNVTELLIDVNSRMEALIRAEDRFRARLAPEFCMFEHFRPNENMLSRCLADLLKPDGTHGQGSVFLREFLDRFKLSDHFVDLESVKVITERRIKDGRIDIALEFEDGIVGIENKPWATDGDGQLSKYAQFLVKSPREDEENWWLLYLSNTEPSQKSLNDDEKESYGEHFRPIEFKKLEEFLWESSRCANATSVRVFLEEFAKYIRLNINGDLDMAEQEEVQSSVLRSADHLKGAFAIQSAWPEIQQELLNRFEKSLKNSLKKNFSRDFPRVAKFDMSGKNWCGFSFELFSESDFHLRFEFEGRGFEKLCWGIADAREPVNPEDPDREKIIKTMQEAFKKEGESTKWWPWFVWAGDIPDLEEMYLHWKTSPEPWVSLFEGSKFVDSIIKIVEKVREAFSGKEDLLRASKD